MEFGKLLGEGRYDGDRRVSPATLDWYWKRSKRKKEILDEYDQPTRSHNIRKCVLCALGLFALTKHLQTGM